jgi:hypothetical protein
MGEWDTSSVVDMNSMFYVRAPPHPVLLRVCVVARRPSPRFDIATHPAQPSGTRCAVECHCLQSAHRWMEHELGDGYGWHVPRTCSFWSMWLSPCIGAHPTQATVPHCTVGSQQLQSARWWVGHELSDEHEIHARCTYSRIACVDARLFPRRLSPKCVDAHSSRTSGPRRIVEYQRIQSAHR